MFTIEHTKLRGSGCTLQASNGKDPLSLQFRATPATMLFTEYISSKMAALTKEMEVLLSLSKEINFSLGPRGLSRLGLNSHFLSDLDILLFLWFAIPQA
jgi:hypothetical protein